jgi:hypothetical protein
LYGNQFLKVKFKSFLVQQFFKNAAEVKGEEPLTSPAGDEIPRAIFRHTERRVRTSSEKSDSFSRYGE